MIVALSTSGVPRDGHGVRVPREELERIRGFDADDEVWVTTSEINQTDHEHPYFVRAEYRGTFSEAWVRETILRDIEGIVRLAAARAQKGS
jgi:hypothetical protein